MKCSLCKEISDRLNELDELHGEEFIKQFKELMKYRPTFGERARTEVSIEELLHHKKAQYEAGWLDAIEEINNMEENVDATQ